jgi:hypothetical protein
MASILPCVLLSPPVIAHKFCYGHVKLLALRRKPVKTNRSFELKHSFTSRMMADCTIFWMLAWQARGISGLWKERMALLLLSEHASIAWGWL